MAPKRLQRMLLRLQKYNLLVEYLPGAQMYIADMLSRAYVKSDTTHSDNVENYQVFQLHKQQQLYEEIATINQMDYICMSAATSQQVKACTSADATLQCLMNTVMIGWPDTRDQVPVSIREYWNFREEITVQDGIMFKGMKIIIPLAMRAQMIAKSHTSHLGAEACVRRARDVLFWPGMANDIRNKVQSCEICNDFQTKQQKEPLMTHKIPETPWSKVGQDLCSYRGEQYLVTVDYYSDYIEVDKLSDTTASTVIEATKAHFARHGIADMVTDNGPQYTSEDFARFKREWGFEHSTSSPLYSQSNGKAESAVKIAKNIIKKALRDGSDVHMALLEWRNTPDLNGTSPAQKLFSRRTRTVMPTAQQLLMPKVIGDVSENIKLKRQKSKLQFDKSAKLLPELNIGDPIRLQPQNPKMPWSKGSCVAKVGPRSYLIESNDGAIYRRNRKFIRLDKSASVPETDTRKASEPVASASDTASHQTDVPPSSDVLSSTPDRVGICQRL